MTEIQTDPIEAKAPVRSEAANDNTNVTEITSADIVGEKASVARSRKLSATERDAINRSDIDPAAVARDAAENALRLSLQEKLNKKTDSQRKLTKFNQNSRNKLLEKEENGESFFADQLTAARDSLKKGKLQRETDELDIPIDVVHSTIPKLAKKPLAENLALKKKLEYTKKLTELKDARVELPDANEEEYARQLAKRDAVGRQVDKLEEKQREEKAKQQYEIIAKREAKKAVDTAKVEALRKDIEDLKPLSEARVVELTPRNAEKEAAIRHAFRGKNRIEKTSGIGVQEEEWLGKGKRMGKPKKSESAEDTKMMDARERGYDRRLQRQQAEEKASIAQAKPGFWKRAGGFFKNIFGASKEPTLDDLLEPVLVDSARPVRKEASPAPVVEQRETKLEPVSMSAVLDLWNKDYAKRGVRLVLDKMPNDGRDSVNASVLDIKSRLKQRLSPQLQKNNVSDFEYNRKIEPLIEELATAVVQNAERAAQYKQRSYPKFPKKAA